jgi:DGQHR domain-containing protein
MMAPELRLNALRIDQRTDIPIYVFGIEGRLIFSIATVSYAERTKDGILSGYQRPAVKAHIQDIFEYLSEANALLPNSIVVAFDDRVTFEALPGLQPSEWGTFGRVQIPLPRHGGETKPGWIVDGQQRVTALAKLDPKRHFPVVVVGFQSSSQEFQREQFLLVNKTKPLPRDLLHELLPDVHARLPRDLAKRQVAAQVVQHLRFDSDSPFYQRIRGLGAVGDGSNISQASVISVVQTSIKKKGVLSDHFGLSSNTHDVKSMARVVSVFFEGVRRTWPDAWEESPKTSRLVHGIGIVALGHLMERVMLAVDAASPKAASVVAHRLEPLKARCAWTSGHWPVLNCPWNELENTSRDKTRLTDYLLKEYKRLH